MRFLASLVGAYIALWALCLAVAMFVNGVKDAMLLDAHTRNVVVGVPIVILAVYGVFWLLFLYKPKS